MFERPAANQRRVAPGSASTVVPLEARMSEARESRAVDRASALLVRPDQASDATLARLHGQFNALIRQRQFASRPEGTEMLVEALVPVPGVGTENGGRQAVVGSVGDARMAHVPEAPSAAAEEGEIADEGQHPVQAQN